MNSFQRAALDYNVSHQSAVPPGVSKIIADLVEQVERLKAEKLESLMREGDHLRKIKKMDAEIRAMKREADAATGSLFRNQGA